jgi:hypothetical protein
MFKKRIYALLLMTLLFTVVVAMPIDLSGQWQAKVESPQDTVSYVFNFDVKGDSFTGTVKITNKKEEATGQITDGKIDGNKIVFTVHIPIDGAPGTASASGILSGDQMKLTIEGEDPHDGHRKMELTIERAR